MFGTHVQEKRAIGIFVSHAMVSDATLPCLVVPSYSSIEVAKHNQLVAPWDSADRCLQTFGKTSFSSSGYVIVGAYALTMVCYTLFITLVAKYPDAPYNSCLGKLWITQPATSSLSWYLTSPGNRTMLR